MDVHCHCHRRNYPEILKNYVGIVKKLIKGWGKNDFLGFSDCIIKNNKKSELAFAIAVEMSSKT